MHLDLEDMMADELGCGPVGCAEDELGQFSFGTSGSFSLSPTQASGSAKASTARKMFTTGLRSPFARITSTIKKAANAAKLAAARKKAPLTSRQRFVANIIKSGKKPTVRRAPASAVMRLKRPVTYQSQFPLKKLPISVTSPAAYRHLACNAGMGGESGLALLRQIKQAVDLTNTRMLATSEHNAINNEQAFRRAVLKGLRQRMRKC